MCPCYLRLLFCPTRVLRGHLLCVCVLTDLDETPFIHTTLSILWLLSRRIKTKVCEVYTMTWAVGGKFLCCSCLWGPTVILNMQKMFSSRVFCTVKKLCRVLYTHSAMPPNLDSFGYVHNFISLTVIRVECEKPLISARSCWILPTRDNKAFECALWLSKPCWHAGAVTSKTVSHWL